MFSTGWDQAVPVPNWARSHSQVPFPDPSPMGTLSWSAVGLQTLGGSGRDVGVLRLWG